MTKDYNRFTKFLVLLLILLALIALGGCRSIKVVTATESHTDSTYIATNWMEMLMRTISQKDSVYIHDSIIIDKTGDTTRIDRSHISEHWSTIHDTIYLSRETHDTIYITNRDTIPQIVEVEKKLTKWQQARMRFGGAAMVLLVCAGVVWVVKRKT